ncbi:hypothetical protein J4216_00170 [Candidatus Woesearchaeota archaeon]|nr:hypothetical protein [Candidatus Woesearchaeota archaeon]
MKESTLERRIKQIIDKRADAIENRVQSKEVSEAERRRLFHEIKRLKFYLNNRGFSTDIDKETGIPRVTKRGIQEGEYGPRLYFDIQNYSTYKEFSMDLGLNRKFKTNQRIDKIRVTVYPQIVDHEGKVPDGIDSPSDLEISYLAHLDAGSDSSQISEEIRKKYKEITREPAVIRMEHKKDCAMHEAYYLAREIPRNLGIEVEVLP